MTNTFPVPLRVVLPELPDAIATLSGHRIPLGHLPAQALEEIARAWGRRLVEKSESERARVAAGVGAEVAAQRHEDCAHRFEANYGLNDSHHRYCTKCGILEDAASDRALRPQRPQISVERPAAVGEGNRDLPAEDKRAAGLIHKYRVERTDGDPTGKHRDCLHFVLDVRHDPHAIPALEAYAASCEIDGYAALAADLRKIVSAARQAMH